MLGHKDILLGNTAGLYGGFDSTISGSITAADTGDSGCGYDALFGSCTNNLVSYMKTNSTHGSNRIYFGFLPSSIRNDTIGGKILVCRFKLAIDGICSTGVCSSIHYFTKGKIPAWYTNVCQGICNYISRRDGINLCSITECRKVTWPNIANSNDIAWAEYDPGQYNSAAHHFLLTVNPVEVRYYDTEVISLEYLLPVSALMVAGNTYNFSLQYNVDAVIS